jgi:hypothetical protein
MTMPVLISTQPVYDTKEVTTGKGKKKATRTLITRQRAGSACAVWANPGEPQHYRSRKDAQRRRNVIHGFTFAIVYLRPDGWWEAGRGWDTLADAKSDGEDHDWRGGEWGIVKIATDARKIEASQNVIFAAMFRR